jgi:hypothetical protein
MDRTKNKAKMVLSVAMVRNGWCIYTGKMVRKMVLSTSVSWAPICRLIERFNEREKSHDLFLFLGGKEIEKGPKII